MNYKEFVKKISVNADKKIKQKSYLISGELPIIDQGASLIGGYTNDYSKEIVCILPVIVFGDHTKKVKYVNFPFAAGADGIKVLQAKEEVSTKYLFYATQYLTYIIPDKGYARHYQFLEKSELDVPALPEQVRIVQKIEELFTDIDKGVEELEQAKERLKVYRQAVLKEAFEGVKAFGLVQDHTSLVTSGSRGWAKYYNDFGDKFIRIGNLSRETILLDTSDIQYVALPNNVEGTRSKIQQHDILISITADLGSIAYISDELGTAYINQHIALVRFLNPLLAKCYAYFFRSKVGQNSLLKNKRGAGKLGLGLEDIRNANIPTFNEDIALKIVQEIEAKLSTCDKQEQIINESLQKAESLRQSILKQAFEGRLV